MIIRDERSETRIRGDSRRRHASVRNAMLGWKGKQEAVHSDRRVNSRLRACLVCELAHGSSEPRRGQCRRQSCLPDPDLSRLHRDWVPRADGSRRQRDHRRRVLGRIAGERRRARRDGCFQRHPRTDRAARSRRVSLTGADGSSRKDATACLTGARRGVRASASLAPEGAMASKVGDTPSDGFLT